jgi:acetyl-CoA acetyltransferase/uncharacterized OB-fold protein
VHALTCIDAAGKVKSMNEASPGAVIAGLGMTDLGRVFGSSQRRLAAAAVRAAVADAGLTVADIDGLLICPGITGGLDVGLAGALGLRDLALLAVVNTFGASAVTAVQTAALAVNSGAARAVACVFADTPLREGVRAGSAFGSQDPDGALGPPERVGFAGLAAGYGFRSVTVHYALAARRHMERFGTTSEQLGAIAVAQRQWAAGSPAAQQRDPITVADHQRSRWVAEPLHLLDCSLVSNGAVAVLVTSPGIAAAGPKPPVHIWGWGQGHPGQPMASGSDFGLVTGAVQAGRAAMGMAGVSPVDVTMCQLYDCYTYTVLVTLEDYGFCAKGEGGPFVASGALAPGGSLPVNTGGGQLSGYYMWGFTPLSEAIIQARGEGCERQSPATDLILVSGNGGILAHHGTLILSPHERTGRSIVKQEKIPRPAVAAPPHRLPAAEDRARAPLAYPELAEGDGAGTRRPVEAGGPGGPESVGRIRADERSAEFLAGAGRGELLIKRCDRCQRWLAPSVSGCPDCGDAGSLQWVRAAGGGTLVSWAVVHPRQPGGPTAVPALVELDEGPWLATGLRLAEPAELAGLRAGQRVTVEFASSPDSESYPVFRTLGTAVEPVGLASVADCGRATGPIPG